MSEDLAAFAIRKRPNGLVLTLYTSSTLTSPIITLLVGREPRVFACHEDVLSLSPFFVAALKGQFFESMSKRVALPDEYVFDSIYIIHKSLNR